MASRPRSFHDDLADPKSQDPVARESTRLTAAAVNGAQTSLDPKQLREWMPNAVYGGHAFGFRTPKGSRKDEFEKALAARAKILPWIREYSPIELVTKDDPPVLLLYTRSIDTEISTQGIGIHHPRFGVALKEKMDELKIPCEVVAGGKRLGGGTPTRPIDFLKTHFGLRK